MARLLKEGLDRHNAIHAIGTVVAGKIFQAVKHGEDPTENYVEELNRLTAARWMSEYAGEPHDTSSRGRTAPSTKKRRRKKK